MIHSMLSTGFNRAIRLSIAGSITLTLLSINAQPAAAITAGVTIYVNTIADSQDGTDNVCSLREAVFAANDNIASGDLTSYPNECIAGTTGLDTIDFDATKAVFQANAALSLSSSLPAITAPVRITNDGPYNYNGSKVKIEGPGAGTVGFTFVAGSAGSTLNRLVITNWGSAGVMLDTDSGHITLTNNYIGVDSGGVSSQANGVGIYIRSSNNLIGGLDTNGQPRTNVISGNTDYGIQVVSGTNNKIQGNWIGVDNTGIAGLGNSIGIFIQANAVTTTVGGILPYLGNVIGANINSGIFIEAGAKATHIQRNLIGLGSDGLTSMSNNNAGIVDYGGIGTLIGGPMPQASNFIANQANGIYLQGTAMSTVNITGNLIGADGHGNPKGNSSAGIFFNSAPHGTSIKNNLFMQNQFAINFGTSGIANAIVTQNCFTTSNDDVNSGAGTQKVASNWWGVSSGPNTGGAGTSGAGALLYTPFLTKAPSSCLGWAPKSFSPKDQIFFNKKTSLTALKWSKVSTASSYDYVLNYNGGLLNSQNGMPTTSVLQPLALDYGAYTWTTTTHTADGFAWPGAMHTFYVTTMTSPKPGTTVTLDAFNQMTFKWLAYPNAASYTLDLYDDTSCLGTLLASPTILSTSASGFYFGFTPGQDYSWQVEPNNGGTMPCWSFTTAP